MNSEEIKIKGSESLRSNTHMLKKETKFRTRTNNTNNTNTTLIEEENDIPKTSPLIHIRQYSYLSESIINYIGIGLCLFIHGCHGLEWFDVENERNNQFYFGYYLFSGIILYIIGILNWYEGKELIFLLDFLLSFLFVAKYLKNQAHCFGYISDFYTNNEKLEGIFYILLFSMIFIIGISSKDKGIIFIIDYAVLFITYVFLFAYKFFKTKIIGDIDNYMFIVAGGLFWLTGIFKLLNNLLESSIVIFEPTD